MAVAERRPAAKQSSRKRRELALKEHARQLANGKVPSPTMRAVTAYADFLRFGVLPYGGGTFDQPATLMEELRIVHNEYSRVKDKQTNRQQRRAGRRGR